MIEKIFKHVLKNGLTVLIMPRHQVPKVSLQLWYNVGSKDEESGARGLAHLIEHMIFKGTEKLSETDINIITNKLSGVCNAFTSNDYTGYLFDVPSQHWLEVLPVMADCMKNCTFKKEFLNSELKAIIQELKMYNDDYLSTLIEKMVTSMFPDHPYHYPVIGFKQDLWNVSRAQILSFYRRFYGPNNAVLVIVGDVDIEEAFDNIEKAFGSIEPLKTIPKKATYHTFDITNQNVTIYREVQQPLMLFAWTIPGVSEKKEYLLDLMSWLVGAGRGARLYNRLVTELGIATELQSFVYDLFDCGIFFIYAQPRTLEDMPRIKEVILEEIEKLRKGEISDKEIARARRKTDMDLLSLPENNQKLAYMLGKYYLATGDDGFLNQYASYPQENIKADLKELFERYFSPALASSGTMLPLSEQDRDLWLLQQETSDAEDARILEGKKRKAPIEGPRYSENITIAPPKKFAYPRAQTFTLSNGLKVFALDRPGSGKIDLILDLKAKHFYDSVEEQGLSMLMTDLLQEGTTKHSAQELAEEIESLGMELNTFPGQMSITMLTEDADKGLELLAEVLMQPAFDKESIERVRSQMISELKLFWDNPTDFFGQIARQKIYGTHPYSHNMMGTEKTVASLGKKDIKRVYERSITPNGGRIAIVGDFGKTDPKTLLQKHLGEWTGAPVKDFDFPSIAPVKHDIVSYPFNRDQLVLGYGGLSVKRLHEDFDALLLFDQTFTGGVLGSMGSRLFELREQSGLFYTIGGSILAGSALQPGMIFIKALVSSDRLFEAEKAIEGVIKKGAQDLTDNELEEARNALINSLVDHFAAQKQIAATFLSLDTYGFPTDYFDTRPERLLSIKKETVQAAAARLLDPQKLVKFRVGRIPA
ncbi:TPA: hypothetical protein DEG75_02790 [Candidatus Dependentiae bacterium]|nr:hypothetical protein [Candidatus Dependentiae bacterium]